MKVKHAMSHRVLVVRPDDPISEARRRMGWMGARHLPVVDPERGLVGLVGGRDLLPFLFAGTPVHGVSVADVMHAPAETIGPGETLAVAAQRMSARGIGALVVVDGGALVGILTVADVLAAGVSRRPARASIGATVGSLMTTWPVALHEGDDLLEAVGRMLAGGVRHLPVVDRERHVVGMLSDRDVRELRGDPLRAWIEGAAGQKVTEVMNTTPVTIEAGETLADAAERLVAEKVDALAVVDREERLVGMLSWLDILARMRPPELAAERSLRRRRRRNDRQEHV